MVGLVVVSHSARLADGVAELMRGMAGPDVHIATAGGLDLPGRPLGTDANLIHNAITQVYSDAGVVVLVDLGSAILSTEMALEMFAPEQRAHIVLAPAALVEGGLAAAVQARLGSELGAVVAEAHAALDAKLAQMGAPGENVPPPAAAAAATLAQSAPSLTLDVTNPLGLHARPAARLVQIAARFAADVQLRDLMTGRGPVNAKSINAVTTLGVAQGHTIEITASGAQAQAALDALGQLARENFGDAPAAPWSATPPLAAPAARAGENEWIGLAASPGIAIGAARLYQPAVPEIPQTKIDDPSGEWVRLQTAIEQAQAQLRATRAALNGRNTLPEAEIFDAQALMLQDQALLEPARRAIFEEHLNAALAFERAAETIVAAYHALADEYLRARAADVRAVARQVLLQLLGVSHHIALEPGILVASDLTPAETAGLDPQTVYAICTAQGGPTGHSAILAKSMGIPAVVGLGTDILRVANGDTLIVDGTQGRVWHNPDDALVARYTAELEMARAAAQANALRRDEPGRTADGRHVEIAANIGSLQDAKQAVKMGAEAVGLFRTEFLFLDRRDAPTEDEQYSVYRAIAETLQGRPLVVRTLDIGGDKPLPYIPLPRQANPFLGLRGLRLSLAHMDLFKTQLRAILRVAAEFPLRVMFPMVTNVRELRDARALIDLVLEDLKQENLARPERVETGIMVEVPAAALAARRFAPELDFFSIGTNDLTQYTTAAERGNPNVAALADSLHPAVLELISLVVTAAHAQNKWVGVCGEMAGDPAAIPLLVGLGIDELSMAPPLIPAAKQIVRDLDFMAAAASVRAMLDVG